MAAKKYIVAKGYSFTAGGHIYVAGEEISEKVFADKKVFAVCLSKGSIIAVGEDVTEKTEEAPKSAEVEKPVEKEVKKTKKGE